MEDTSIWVETKVSNVTGEPAVVLRWYDRSGELSPKEARSLALQVLEAAEAAESDAFIVHFMAEKIGVGKQEQAIMLQQFREFREEQNARG